VFSVVPVLPGNVASNVAVLPGIVAQVRFRYAPCRVLWRVSPATTPDTASESIALARSLSSTQILRQVLSLRCAA